MPRMRRARLGVACVAAAALTALTAAHAQELAAFFHSSADIERRLLADELRRHSDARRRETVALQQASDLQARLDGGLATDLAIDQLEEIERALAGARQLAATAGAEAAALRRTAYERRRRIDALVDAARASTPAASQRSALDGTWDLRMMPMDQTGALELRVDGTLVAGGYRMANGRYGSFRGTWAGGNLRLERVDAESGFDTILEARLSPDGRRLDGSWQATLLNSAGPSGGTWVAVRREPRGRQQ
jgi:hypothetical protein